ncbi:hypothetical protein QBC34DRAFT_423511 [Podospora aff. communis PSN243]|uniref:P-type phospholipid transporter n=1 Tax=Podospora aff. communis PSN243 TaxID=3040156 RepID=A0AAV9GUH4_9PEZI|nr:hypothetical protein QBC34DRAFT_423511 [Podospora aff. communis PSN243]
MTGSRKSQSRQRPAEEIPSPALRDQLDQIELHQRELPVSPTTAAPGQHTSPTHSIPPDSRGLSTGHSDAQHQELPWTPLTPSPTGTWRSQPRARFADPDPLNRSQPSRPSLHLQTGLYTIKSHTAVDGEPAGRARPTLADTRRISLTSPRQRFDDVDGDGKSAMPSAQETHATLSHYRSWVTRRREKKRKRTSRPWGRFKAAAATAYQRYTVWDFLPKQLFFQFSKLANFYFLVIGIMQMIPGLSTTGTYTTIGPLIFFVGFSMAKEGYDDYRRYQLDKQENRSSAWVLDPEGTVKRRRRRRQKANAKTEKSADAAVQMTDLQGVRTGVEDTAPWVEIEWQDVRVGDIIRLRRDDNVPADIALLHATGPNGMAYIETMALDGETNLKSKQACPLLAEECSTVAGMAALEAEVVSEDPNLDLYNYEGRVTAKGKTMPLTMNQVLYRGSTLRNTNQAVGLVINTGEECKIRMNAHKNVRAKAPEMQYAVNRIVILLVFFVVALSIGLTIGYQIWRRRTESRAFYLRRSSVPLKEILIGFIIVFNTLIPLSLYVSLEIVKLGQLYFLRDVEMYDPISDTPMGANTSTILENLGQVSYVFSDKTGTLTENIMKFRKMSVAGTAFLHDQDLQEAEEQRNKGKKGLTEKPKKPGRGFSRKHAAATDFASGNGRPSEDIDARRHSTTLPAYTPQADVTQPELLKTEDLIRYLRLKPNTPFSRKVRQFILCIALCHTCLPETGDDGEITFQAASPDELALVEAARDLGYLLIDRPAQAIKLQTVDINGLTIVETYEVLDVIEFSSKRKRMSIIIRMPDGRVCLFIKGADSAVLPRLRQRKLALDAVSTVERRASFRKSMEQEKALMRLSYHNPNRDSMNLGRASSTLDRRNSRIGGMRRSLNMTREAESRLSRYENGENSRRSVADDAGQYARPSMTRARSSIDTTLSTDPYDGFVDEALSLNEGAVFERCFQHVDDFASEGLRTLIYAYRYLEEDEYLKWKQVYHEATTSLVNRQEQIEAAAEIVEQSFDLAGATAIEDKLQHGVPETIDNLCRANIKVWMLTGDKRETAINIAHSARICKPFSEIYILDVTQDNLQEKVAATLIDVGRGMAPHSVVVIDGHTLSVVEEDESLKSMFFDLVARVDSVICCRASPSQKATLVKSIRDINPSLVTLAIGDGANDIAMIQASHVGIGISGREGLQAARISDYSIAQFRFLQRLLFVHGRWIYIRTGKYILGTFWKEMVFYVLQAHFQQYNGFTGTSLFESASLTVFNTVFTSLPVIIPGIFEKDLSAATLMAVPELYTFGQRCMGFNMKIYFGWMLMALVESAIIYYTIYYVYASSHSPVWVDLFAVGQLAFGVAVIFINVKLFILEVHSRSVIVLGAFFLSLLGWFLWNILLALLYSSRPAPYFVRDGFIKGFGDTWMWWLVTFMVLSAVVVFELAVSALRKSLFPTDQDLMQEVEQVDGAVYLLNKRSHAAGPGAGEAGAGDNVETAGNGKPTRHGRRGDAVSIKTITSASSETPEAVTGFSWPWEGSGNSGPGKRGSRYTPGEEFLRPPFTPTAEEREDGAETSEEGSKKAQKPRVMISEERRGRCLRAIGLVWENVGLVKVRAGRVDRGPVTQNPQVGRVGSLLQSPGIQTGTNPLRSPDLKPTTAPVSTSGPYTNTIPLDSTLSKPADMKPSITTTSHVAQGSTVTFTTMLSEQPHVGSTPHWGGTLTEQPTTSPAPTHPRPHKHPTTTASTSHTSSPTVSTSSTKAPNYTTPPLPLSSTPQPNNDTHAHALAMPVPAIVVLALLSVIGPLIFAFIKYRRRKAHLVINPSDAPAKPPRRDPPIDHEKHVHFELSSSPIPERTFSTRSRDSQVHGDGRDGFLALPGFDKAANKACLGIKSIFQVEMDALVIPTLLILLTPLYILYLSTLTSALATAFDYLRNSMTALFTTPPALPAKAEAKPEPAPEVKREPHYNSLEERCRALGKPYYRDYEIDWDAGFEDPVRERDERFCRDLKAWEAKRRRGGGWGIREGYKGEWG